MQAPSVDDRYFPLVINTIGPRLEPGHLAPFFAASEAVLRRREPYVTISDVSATRELPNAIVRRELAEWSKEFEPLMQQFTIGSAIVIQSTLIRGGLTALFWLAPPPYPQSVVASVREALDSVEKHYAASGRPAVSGFSSFRAELDLRERRLGS